MQTVHRRFDIDWLRVIAIGLLLIYHVAIGFQPWGVMIGFITNKDPWQSLWIPMSMLNVWRIPLLFLVSGMGVYFAMQTRTWKQLLLERARRILLPFVFGMVAIVPVGVYLWKRYYKLEPTYDIHPAHLWFLGNIFAYIVLLSPLFYYLQHTDSGKKMLSGLKKMLSSPLGLIPFVLFFIAEVLIVRPMPFEVYAVTWHGFFLGLVVFFSGFCFVAAGDSFRDMVVRWRWFFFITATLLFIVRTPLQMKVPGYLLAIESSCWMFTVLAFASLYLNRDGKVLRYLSNAVLPVYIVHMIFIHLSAMLVMPLDLDVRLKFLLVLVSTLAGCLAFYHLILLRIRVLWPLFGMRVTIKKNLPSATTVPSDQTRL